MSNNGISLWRDVFNNNNSPITEFRRDFDRLLDGWLTPANSGLRASSNFIPACDVEEEEDHYLLTLDTPGVKKEDIKMEVVDNQIVISGERQSESRKKEDSYAYSERRFGRFQRVFALPPGVDPGQVEANYQDGILRIVVPKAESAKPRQIKITDSNAGASKFFGKLLSSKGREKEKGEAETFSRGSDRAAS